MSGYDGTPGRPALYANASADGCPIETATGGACDNGWNQGWVWHNGWEFDSALPFPQIYATSGVNAHQWQLIDLYATTRLGDGMYFYGSMSQWGACQQTGDGPMVLDIRISRSVVSVPYSRLWFGEDV